MTRPTKKAKTQALPALANALRHVSTSNRDPLVEDNRDLDDTSSSNTVTDSSSEDDETFSSLLFIKERASIYNSIYY